MRNLLTPLRHYARRVSARGRNAYGAWRDRHGYSEAEALTRLAGSITALVVLVPIVLWLALQLVSIVAGFLGWVFTDQPEPPPQPDGPPTAWERSLNHGVPALASLVTSAVTHWFSVHTRGLGISASALGIIWSTGAGVIVLGALAQVRGAQLGYGLLAAATTWIAWAGAPPEARLVVAGTVALAFAVAGLFTLGRVHTRIHNFIDARGRDTSPSELQQDRQTVDALRTIADAAERIARDEQKTRL